MDVDLRQSQIALVGFLRLFVLQDKDKRDRKKRERCVYIKLGSFPQNTAEIGIILIDLMFLVNNVTTQGRFF